MKSKRHFVRTGRDYDEIELGVRAHVFCVKIRTDQQSNVRIDGRLGVLNFRHSYTNLCGLGTQLTTQLN